VVLTLLYPFDFSFSNAATWIAATSLTTDIITFALGDKWMLVIIKQMLIEDKMTFKDFTESDEAIATGILSSKLKCLQELGIITKT